MIYCYRSKIINITNLVYVPFIPAVFSFDLGFCQDLVKIKDLCPPS